MLYHGKEYTVSELSRLYNIPKTTIYSRLKVGKELNHAVKKTRYGRVCQDHLGKYYQSKTAMAKAYSIKAKTLYSRLEYGFSLKEALTLDDSVRRKRLRDPEGNYFKSYRDMAESHGVLFNTFVRRINRLGWDLERALIPPVKK